MSNNIPSSCRVPFFAGNKEIKFAQKTVPEPETGQLLLRVRANALCGSERPQFFDGTSVTPGHEATGTVVAVGPRTHTVVGTTGAVYLMDFCGECRSCRLGFTNQCLQKRGDMGFNRDGGYGQYELVHENIFFPVPDEFSPTEATLLLDIMGTGGHAIDRCRLMRPDIESLLVSGAGPIGLGVLAMAKIIIGQQLKVLITDVVPYRLRLAERLGGLPINVGQTSLRAGIELRIGLRRHGSRYQWKTDRTPGSRRFNSPARLANLRRARRRNRAQDFARYHCPRAEYCWKRVFPV